MIKEYLLVKLLDIKDLVQKIAEAISSVLEMDVIISDCDYNKIADTKKHYDLEVTTIKDTYVLGKVIRTGKAVVVEGKEYEEQCIKCEGKDKCNLQAMICIPIQFREKTLGAIALIAITEETRDDLLKNRNNLIEYMNRMAELIIGKVMEQEASNNLEIVKNQMVHIMNSIDEGIITLDETGCILYVNSVIYNFFSYGEDYFKGKMINEILLEPYIEKLVDENISFSNNETSIKLGGREFNALLSGKPMKIGEKNSGAILTFRNMSDVYNVVNKVSLNDLSISFDSIIGKSSEVERVKETAKRVANSNSTVLILGESGTGKELFARAIHYNSNRRDNPFITLNCAAIPESLLESELFGYEEGSFTGAVKGGKMGKFQLAQGGTVFLDEIGDMPLHLQTKLLRVLQEKTVEKIGSSKSIPLDVRVIAATNKKLDKMVEDREFRGDLYYRLSVIPINIPPLRNRLGDVKILLDYFLAQYNKRLGKNIRGFESDVEDQLLTYEWPGNVRELENIVEYAVNMEKSKYIKMENIPQRIKKNMNEKEGTIITTIDSLEKKAIYDALRVYGNNYEGKISAAEALGIGTATLYRKMKKYGIK